MAPFFINSSPPPPPPHTHHLTDHIFRCIFMNEKFYILIKISLKFVPKCPIDNNTTLVYIMAWHQAIIWTNADKIHWCIYEALGGDELISFSVSACCPACRTTLVATRFRVAVICPIIQVPHCIRVFFYFVWFVFINHIFQFYHELYTYCNILDIYLS